MRTQSGIQANNPLGYALHNTYIAPVISKPSLTTIRTIFQDGDVGDPTVAGASGYVVDTGTGTTTLENIGFKSNIITSTSNNIIFDTDNDLDINTDTALLVTSGTTAQRNNVQGAIRFNTDDNVFEGYNTSTITFDSGVFSDDRLTSVTADPTSDNLKFIVNGDNDPIDSTTLVGEITGDAFSIHSIQVDDINIDANTISTNVSNSDLELIANGTGNIIVDNITVNANTFTNTLADSKFEFASTGAGFTKFTGDSAVGFPAGTTAERPVAPVLGQTRTNTDTGELESYNGTQWQTSAGEFDSISEADMDDIALIQTLVYG
jgi:hypothetical protein